MRGPRISANINYILYWILMESIMDSMGIYIRFEENTS